MRWPLILAAGLLAYAGWEWSRQQQEEGENVIEEATDWASQAIAEINETVVDVANSLTGYSYAKVPEIYRGAIADSEARHGLPGQMLARLLWQECRYKPAIISGRISSPVGAQGIAQFMPATAAEMGIDPLDPFAAIDAAGRYLKSLYRQTGDWAKALAAYNWGIGNVKRKGLERAPLETRNYYRQILADIGMGGAYA